MEYLIEDADPKLVVSGIAQEQMLMNIDPNLNIMVVDSLV